VPPNLFGGGSHRAPARAGRLGAGCGRVDRGCRTGRRPGET